MCASRLRQTSSQAIQVSLCFLLLDRKCHEISVQEEPQEEVMNISKGLRASHVQHQYTSFWLPMNKIRSEIQWLLVILLLFQAGKPSCHLSGVREEAYNLCTATTGRPP